jgi:O-antigen/teichoic acid export membrane protein
MSVVTSTTRLVPGSLLLPRASQAMLSQVLRRTVRFFFLFLAARKLGPEIFGTYVLLLAIAETLSLMTGEGLTDYVAREAAKSPSVARSLFNRVSAVRWLLAIALGPLAVMVLRLLHYSDDVQWSAAFLFLILVARGPLAAAQGLFRAANRMDLLVWLEAANGAALIGFGMYLLAGAATLRTVIVAEVVSACAAAVVAVWLAGRLWARSSASPVTWRAVWRATATFNIYPLITNIYDRVDIVILSVIAGNAAAGLYALPYRVLATLQIIPFGLTAAVLPALAARAESPNDKAACLRLATVLGVLSMFPALVLALLAKPLVHVVLGDSYAASSDILRLLVWAAIPMFVNYGLNTFLLARNKERIFVWTSTVCAIANITLNLILIPRYNYYAAAAVTIVTEVLLLIQNVVIIRKTFDFVALPNRLWIPAGVLALIVAAAQLFGAHFSPLILAAAACGVFTIVLHFNGSLKEIADSMSLGVTRA